MILDRFRPVLQVARERLSDELEPIIVWTPSPVHNPFRESWRVPQLVDVADVLEICSIRSQKTESNPDLFTSSLRIVALSLE